MYLWVRHKAICESGTRLSVRQAQGYLWARYKAFYLWGRHTQGYLCAHTTYTHPVSHCNNHKPETQACVLLCVGTVSSWYQLPDHSQGQVGFHSISNLHTAGYSRPPVSPFSPTGGGHMYIHTSIILLAEDYKPLTMDYLHKYLCHTCQNSSVLHSTETAHVYINGQQKSLRFKRTVILWGESFHSITAFPSSEAK